jgi:hypothetical protein
MAKTYSDKLKDPRWQKKRLEILDRDGFSCCSCGDKESTLHIHHKRYLKGKEPWEYENDLLVTLCEDCHKRWDILRSEIIEIIDSLFCMEDLTAYRDLLNKIKDYPFWDIDRLTEALEIFRKINNNSLEIVDINF